MQNNPPQYHIEPLGKHHERKGFCCGINSLDVYLHRFAAQNIRRKVSSVYVLTLDGNPKVVGYYTLSSTSIVYNNLPKDISKKLPKYPLIPATLLGRLAVDRTYRGCKFGEKLLLDGLYRSYRHSDAIASMAVVVSALNEEAVFFYKHYHFLPLKNTPFTLFLPMKTIQRIFV